MNLWLGIFWGSAILLGYVLIGYPLLLLAGLRMMRRASTVETPIQSWPIVTLIIPAYNESRVLEAKLQNALALDYPRDRLEIMVASDGSSDATVDIARRFVERGVQVLAFEQRRGKASVVNDAAARACGDVLCLCDANVMFAPDALRRLVQPLQDPTVGAVTGTVVIASEDSNFEHGEKLYYHLERTVQTAESQLGSLMGVDGGMYVLRSECFRRLPADTILDDFVLSMQVLRQGLRVLYEPRARATENGTPLAAQEFKRRVRIAAGAAQSVARGNFPSWRTPVECWQYLSHKLLRWLMPVWLLGIFVSSLMLSTTHDFYLFALGCELLVLISAIVGLVSLPTRATRWGGATFYFVMSQAALLWGFGKGILGQQSVTWARADRLSPVPHS